MRSRSALLLAVAATVAACSPLGPATHHGLSATPFALPKTVGCDQIIREDSSPLGRVVLGVLAVPPAHVEAGAPTGGRPWAYFSKFGVDVRAGSPAALITVPRTWRHRVAIGWGNNASGVSSLRLLSCPQQLAPWNSYAGGFFLRSASGCALLTFQIGRQTATLSFAIGRARCRSATV
jgi:hypothetical protein